MSGFDFQPELRVMGHAVMTLRESLADVGLEGLDKMEIHLPRLDWLNLARDIEKDRAASMSYGVLPPQSTTDTRHAFKYCGVTFRPID